MEHEEVPSLGIKSDFFTTKFLGNTPNAYLTAVLIFLCVYLSIQFATTILIKKLKNLAASTATDVDDFVVSMLLAKSSPLHEIIYFFVSLYAATRILYFSSDKLNSVLYAAFVVSIAVRVVQILQSTLWFIVDKWDNYYYKDDPMGKVVLRNGASILGTLLWIAATVFVLDNLGFTISSLLAGLGISGIAVALAVQAILGDAFSAFAIFMDKPFRVGDFVVVGEQIKGTVEYIGFKTTRLTSLDGSKLIVPNREITNRPIQNYRALHHRRMQFSVMISHETPLRLVRLVPQIVREVLDQLRDKEALQVRYMTCALTDLPGSPSAAAPSSSSLCLSPPLYGYKFDIIYMIEGRDVEEYQRVQMQVCLGVKEQFEQQGIEMALPVIKHLQ